MKKSTWIIALVIIVAAFGFWKNRSRFRRHSDSESNQTTEQGKQTPVMARTTPTKTEAQAQERGRIELELGLRRGNLPIVEDKRQLKVKFFSEKRCLPGDVDSMRWYLEHSSKPRLLLSVEPLAKRAFSPVTKEVTLEDILAGSTVELRLPNSTDAIPAAIYVCKDSDGTGRCGDKPMFEYTKPEIPKGAAPDYTFFFNYLMIDEAGAAGFADNYHMDDASYEKVTNYVATEMNTKNKPTELVKRVREFNTKVTSMGIDWQGSTLVLNLPQNDPKMCDVKN